MHFGKLDKTDFLIPPVALFYFYTLFAAAFGWPLAIAERFFRSTRLSHWVGVRALPAGMLILVFSLVSFGNSFRVGIDAEQPGRLVTTGIFAVSRNPIYVGFLLFLIGQFLAFPSCDRLLTAVALRPPVSLGKCCARSSSCGSGTARNTPSTAAGCRRYV